MKRFLLSILLTLSIMASSCTASNIKTTQHAATHRLLFMNNKQEAWYCTGTAIGAHAILTDQHCDEANTNVTVALDANVENKPTTYPIIEKFFDNEDHMIIVVPTLSLKDWISYRPEVYLMPVQGEHIYFWGNPERQIDIYREGYVAGKGDLDIDLPFPAKNPGIYFIVVAGQGDSGAVIYAEDGRIISLLTGHSGAVACGYPLAFTPEQVKKALTDYK